MKLLRLSAAGLLLLAVGCKINNNLTNVNQVQVRILPPDKPAAGCSQIALDAEPSGLDSVILSIDPSAGAYTLLDNGASLGPAFDGQRVKLDSGTHELQVVSGPCSSNVAVVEVP